MIDNKLCVYCGKAMIFKAENHPDGRSVEHMIPNSATSRVRKNCEGDFNACRECNCDKSKFDDLLGKLSKINSCKTDLAVETFKKEIDKNRSRFKTSFESAKPAGEYYELDFPVRANEIVEFIYFLAKGAYFKNTTRIFNKNKQLIIPRFITKQELLFFEDQYLKRNKSNPFRDLEKNKNVENIDSECFIVWAKKSNKAMILIHDYTGFIAEIKTKNNTNLGNQIRAVNELKRRFN